MQVSHDVIHQAASERLGCIRVPLIVGHAIFHMLILSLSYLFVKFVTLIISSVFFCILYVCSNLFFAGFIFARLGNEHSKKVNLFGSLIGSIFMVVCLIGMVISIYLNPYSSMSDMPLVYIASSASHLFGIITLIVVWIGIATTAVSLVYTISAWLQKYVHSFKLCSIAVCIICLIISGLGFGAIVSYFYPILGVFGIIFMLRMVFLERKLFSKRGKIVEK